MKNIDKIIAYSKRILTFIKIIGLKIFSTFRINKFWVKFKNLKLKYKISLAILVVALLIGQKFLFAPGWPQDIKVVEVHKVSKGNLSVKTRLFGTIGAKKYYIATAGDTGTLDFVAPSGSKLKRGEIIAHIDKPEIQKAYDSALELVKIADARYKRELDLEKAKASSKHAVEEKYASLADAHSRLSSAKINLDKILFTAPFDGIVGSALFYPGSKVNPDTEIVTFYDPEDLVIKFDIPSNLLGHLDVSAKVTIDGEEYTTSFIQRVLSGGSYTVPAYVDFKCEKCIVGEILDVDLHTIDKQNIIIVPASCVFIQDGHTMVYKVKDDKVHLSPVKSGVREKDLVEILEGVDEGDVLVSEGQSRLYPEVAVKVHEEDKK